MGLGVSIASLAFARQQDPEGADWLRKQHDAINAALVAAGLPRHREPEDLSPELLPHVGSFPYSFLHCLRRAFVYAQAGEALTPAPADFDPDSDERLTEEMDSHLVCHSDSEGFYVPVDFEEILYVDAVWGCMVGSTHALLRELGVIAPALGIPLESGRLDPATARELADTPDDHPFFRERIAWGALFANAEASLRYGSAIHFS